MPVPLKLLRRVRHRLRRTRLSRHRLRRTRFSRLGLRLPGSGRYGLGRLGGAGGELLLGPNVLHAGRLADAVEQLVLASDTRPGRVVALFALDLRQCTSIALMDSEHKD